MDDIEATLRKLLPEHLDAIAKAVKDIIRRELAGVTKPPAVVYFDNEGIPWREATASDVGQTARFGDYGFAYAMLKPQIEGVLDMTDDTQYGSFKCCGTARGDMFYREAYVRIPHVGKASQ